MAVQLVENWRRPGCGPGCREAWVLTAGLKGRERVEIHDPEAHESYAVGLIDSGAVETGPLRIDLRSQMVSVDGRECFVSPQEWKLLRLLAQRVGSLVPADEFRQAMHGDGWQYASSNTLRTTMGRLRHRLGRAHVLVQTVPYRGYRLVALPPGSEIPADLARPPLPWAINYDACQGCGRTSAPHHSGGWCYACFRSKRVTP